MLLLLITCYFWPTVSRQSLLVINCLQFCFMYLRKYFLALSAYLKYINELKFIIQIVKVYFIN